MKQVRGFRDVLELLQDVLSDVITMFKSFNATPEGERRELSELFN